MFAFFLTTFVDLALPRDLWFLFAVWIGTCHYLGETERVIARGILFAWITLLSKIVKFDWWRRPEDLRYVLLVPLFGWYHSIRIKLHALWSLSEVCANYLLFITWYSTKSCICIDHLGQP